MDMLVDNKSPVFVIGYPRSGTTLLLHILMSSGQFPVYKFTETHFFSHFYRRFGNLAKPSNRARFREEFYDSEAFENSGPDREALEALVESRGVSYENYFACLMQLLSEEQNRPRWLEKTPWHMLYVEEIVRAFPDAQFLLIVRDPRDVALSVCRYGWADGLFSGPVRVAVAWNWHMKFVERELNRVHANWMPIRYEDIVANTQESLDKVNSFLGLGVTMADLEGSKIGVMETSNSSFSKSKGGISSASLGRWKGKMPVELKAAVDFVSRDLLNRYHYESSGEDKVPLVRAASLSLLAAAYGASKAFRHLAFPLVRR